MRANNGCPPRGAITPPAMMDAQLASPSPGPSTAHSPSPCHLLISPDCSAHIHSNYCETINGRAAWVAKLGWLVWQWWWECDGGRLSQRSCVCGGPPATDAIPRHTQALLALYWPGMGFIGDTGSTILLIATATDHHNSDWWMYIYEPYKWRFVILGPGLCHYGLSHSEKMHPFSHSHISGTKNTLTQREKLFHRQLFYTITWAPSAYCPFHQLVCVSVFLFEYLWSKWVNSYLHGKNPASLNLHLKESYKLVLRIFLGLLLLSNNLNHVF